MQGLRFFLLLFLVMVSQLYNAYSFLFVTLLWLGVTFHSPAILTSVGLTAVGPVAGGMFAAHQGATIAAGSLMAAGQRCSHDGGGWCSYGSANGRYCSSSKRGCCGSCERCRG